MTASEQTLDERKEILRRQVMEMIPSGIEISDRELEILIGRRIEETAGEEYIRLGEKRNLRRKVFNSIRKMDVLQDMLEDEEVLETLKTTADTDWVLERLS